MSQENFTTKDISYFQSKGKRIDMEMSVLLEVLRVLTQHTQKEQVLYFLIQLREEGYLWEEDFSLLAEYYGLRINSLSSPGWVKQTPNREL